jgi:hypothetical protein
VSRLFYEDEFQALRDVIEQGKGYEKTAGHLWPGMKSQSAYSKLKACTNEHGDQRLKFGEIIEAMRFNARFDALFYACDELMHARPSQKAAAEEEARIAVIIESSASTLERALQQLAHLRRDKGGRASG